MTDGEFLSMPCRAASLVRPWRLDQQEAPLSNELKSMLLRYLFRYVS
jgi:hypothetical protein